MICKDCNNEFPASEGVTVPGGVVCPSCFEEYDTCYHCTEHVHNSDLSTYRIRDYRGRERAVKICNDCTDQYSTCVSCDLMVHNDHTQEGDGDTYCDRCYNDTFVSCYSCDNPVHTDNIYYHDDDPLCHDCYENRVIRREQERVIRAYDYKPTPVFYGDGDKFGIELEVECRNGNTTEIAQKVQDMVGNWAYLKHDGSIDNGFEIVTHPLSLSFHMNTFPWGQLCSFLVRSGCRSHQTSTCGLHIHAEKKNLSESERIKLALFVNNNVREMVKIARREPSSYAKFKDVSRDKLGLSSNRDRYEALNFRNRHTVEFRLFKGTLKVDTILSSIEFVDAAMRTAKAVNTKQAMTPEALAAFQQIVKETPYLKLPDYLTLRKVCTPETPRNSGNGEY